MLNKFFSTFFWNISGCVTRKQYWSQYFPVVMGYTIIVISAIVFGKNLGFSREILLMVLAMAYLPIIWSGIITSIKRIRDAGLSPWWYVLQLIPYVGIIAGVAFAIIPTGYFIKKYPPLEEELDY